MSFAVTERANLYASQTAISPQIVLTIDGIDERFGAQIVKVLARWGQDGLVWGLEGLVWGGTTESSLSRDFVSMNGTTDTISQQLEPDKGGASSTQSMTIRLADIGGEMSRIVSPGVVVDDILYRNAQVYLAPNPNCAFPEDYIQMFNGKIQGVKTGPSFVDLTIAHPEDLKRSNIFLKAETVTTQKFKFQSVDIQDLFYQARGDVTGTVSIQYQSGGTGQNPTVSVAGNQITVFIDPGVTFAKSIKKKVENDEDANQLVTVKITGNGGAVQAVQAITSLTADSQIFVSDASQFFSAVGTKFLTYARVGDEIVQYTGIDLALNKLTGITRAQLNTFGATADVGETVSSFYVLGDDTSGSGNAIDLSLWLLLSGADTNYAVSDPKNFITISPTEDVTNAIFYDGIDVKTLYNITVGDLVSSTGAANAANNFSGAFVSDIVLTELGSYVVVSGPSLVVELDSAAVVSFQSQYNILPDGVGLLPNQVDIDQFRYIKALYSSSIANYQIYIKDNVTAKDLINQQILLPSALYSIPRKGKISVSMTAPPLYSENTKTLDLTTVKKPSQLKLDRSVNANFYNAIVYKFNDDSLEGKSLSGVVYDSEDSFNQIDSPTKPYVIEAGGLRDTPATRSLIERNADRFLQRYQFAAEGLQVDVPFKVGWTVEVGDSVVFGSDDLKAVDITTGTRKFKPRIFEVLNKELSIKTGDIRLKIVDTAYNQNIRYAVWSPSTTVGTGSTTSVIVITDSFGTSFPKKEKDKWANYLGKDIIIHTADFATSYQTTIQGFDPTNPYKMLIDPAIAGAPAAGWQIDIADYDNITVGDTFLKLVHPFWTPTLDIVTGISTTQFTVSAPHAAKLFVDGIVRVHSDDYTIDSGRKGIKVINITGVTITVETGLGFVPSAGQKIDFVGFVSDEGQPYGWV
jgi:hypothetical protein